MTVAEKLGLITKIAGVAAPLLAVLKTIVNYAIDQSLDRKSEKTMREISITVRRMVRLTTAPNLPLANLNPYRLRLDTDLCKKVKSLEVINTHEVNRERGRNEYPEGLKSWLLLYRPEGFSGLVIQTLYYYLFLNLIGGIVSLAVVLIEDFDLGLLLLLPVFFLHFLIVLYFRTVALRMKRLGISLRKDSLSDPNDDLSRFRKGLLLLKHGDGMWLLRTSYWVILFIAMSSPFIVPSLTPYFHSHFFSSPAGQAILDGGALILCLLYAQVFRSDVLSRRAWGKIEPNQPRSSPTSREVRSRASRKCVGRKCVDRIHIATKLLVPSFSPSSQVCRGGCGDMITSLSW